MVINSWFEVIILSSMVATFLAVGIIFSLSDFDPSFFFLRMTSILVDPYFCPIKPNIGQQKW